MHYFVIDLSEECWIEDADDRMLRNRDDEHELDSAHDAPGVGMKGGDDKESSQDDSHELYLRKVLAVAVDGDKHRGLHQNLGEGDCMEV